MAEYKELINRLRQEAEFEAYLQPHSANETPKLLSDAADAIEELSKERKRGKWIPVTEQMPFAESGDVSETVLVTDGECVALAEWFNFEECEPYWSYTGIGDVTHWMPLPELPKEES